MTNPNLAYVQLIIDRSGSMQSLRSTVVDGLNTFLKGQRALPGVCHVGLCFFGDSIDRVYDSRPLSDIKDMVAADYMPNGGTPLYQAMIESIDQLGFRFAALPEDQRPGLVTVLTITDGQENQSASGCTQAAVRQRVERQTKAYNWQFQFMGANQDAVLTAGELGIAAGSAASFTASAHNTGNAFAAYNASVTRGRSVLRAGGTQLMANASMAYSTAERDSMTDPTADLQPVDLTIGTPVVGANATISATPAP